MWNKVPKREYIKGNGYAPKKNPDKIINKGVIYDPMGQWKYPGEVTKIPGNTMATHGYGNIPLWVVPNNDPPRLVQPNSGQQLFRNSTNFTEYPQLRIAQRGGVLQPGGGGRWLDSVRDQFNKQYGGDPSIPKLNQMKKGGWLEGYSKQTKLRGDRGYTSKNIKTSINKLMLRNETLFGPAGKKIYDPLSKFQPGGGVNVPTIEYTDEMGSQYDPVIQTSYINPKDPEQAKIHELWHHYQNAKGWTRSYDSPMMEKPQTPASDEMLQEYYNRRKNEVNTLIKGFKQKYPEFNMVPDNVIYNRQVENQMYDQPWTLEGEGRAVESPEGREWLSDEGYDMQEFEDLANRSGIGYPKKQLGGWLNKYQPGGDTKKDYYAKSPEDYAKRNQMYNDSLNYYNNSIHDINLYENSNKGWNFKRGYKKDFPVSIAPNFKYEEKYKPTGFLTYASNKSNDGTLGNYPLWEAKSDIIPSSDSGINTTFNTETDYIPLYKAPTQRVHPYVKPIPPVNNISSNTIYQPPAKPIVSTPKKVETKDSTPTSKFEIRYNQGRDFHGEPKDYRYTAPDGSVQFLSEETFNRMSKGKPVGTYKTRQQLEDEKVKKQMGGWLDHYQNGGPKLDRSLMGTVSNPSETVNQPVKEDPYKKGAIQVASDKQKDAEKKALAEKYYNERKNQHMIGQQGTPEELDQINKDVSSYSANNAIDYAHKPTSGKVKDFATDMALGLIGSGAYSSLGKGIGVLAKEEQVASGLSKFVPKELPGSSNVGAVEAVTQPVAKSVQQPLALQEMPGLHLKSTMSGSPLEKQISKTGEININSIKAHIGKAEVGQQDKFIIDKVLNEKFAGKTKINYNDFKKAVSEELVPLERNIITNYKNSNWGVGRLGYPNAQKSSYDAAIKESERQIESYTKSIKDNPGITEKDLYILKNDKEALANAQKSLKENRLLHSQLPLENNSITYSNSSKFGRGSADHFDENTLGHARTLVSKEEPDVMHVLEQQSDYYQKHGINSSEKIVNNANTISNKKAIESINKYKNAKKQLDGSYLVDFGDGNTATFIDKTELNNAINNLNKGIEKRQVINIEQKEFLGKNHQERLLQENAAYAVEQGKSKMRYPTSETAAKIQGYTPKESLTNKEAIQELKEIGLDYSNLESSDKSGIISDISYIENHLDKYPNIDLAQLKKVKYKIENDPSLFTNRFTNSHQTILKKYDDTPKMIKKVLGKEAKVVTDPKGNTWYEFDIPDAAKKGKFEIKAFSLGGAALNQKKHGGWLNKYS